MTTHPTPISTLEQGLAPSTPESSLDGFSVAADEINGIAVQQNDGLNYQVLDTSIDISFLDLRELNSINGTPRPKHQNEEQTQNTIDPEQEKRSGGKGGSTHPFLSTISTQFQSNSDVGTPSSLPHSRGDGDFESKKEIEESDAELIGEGNLRGDEEVDLPMSAAIAPFRGRGLPNIRRKPNLRFEPSEVTDITDLGNHLYDLKTQGRILSPGLPISQDDPKEPLQNRLIDTLQETPGYPEKKGFFPRDLLASLIDEECVIEELKSEFQNLLDIETIRKCAREICGVAPTGDEGIVRPLYKKIFVILVLSEKTSTILKFLAEKVTDDDLPLAKVRRPGKKTGIFDLGRRGAPTIALECFHGWTTLAIRRFEEWQWSTISPFFARSKGRKNVKHFPLQDQVILPFTSDSRRDADAYERLEFEGGFSQVFQVKIHPEHHDFHDHNFTDRGFAIKCLLSRDRKDFDREVEMLKKFSGDSHPHLVSLLTTYEQFHRFYLVFHWAEADLLDYWKERNPNPSVDHKTIHWMAQQCRGIANGLSRIHHYESSNSKVNLNSARKFSGVSEQNLAPPRPQAQPNGMEKLYGRHGDIKPANVLLFRDPDVDENMGTLKLTDFGLAEFSAFHSRSYKPKSKVATSPSYRPPECDLQNGVIGRSYDIWTLGCLYLEFITWLLGGWDLVQEFTKKRTSHDPMWADIPTDTFFEIVKCSDTGTPGAMIKPTVTDFISELHHHKSCTEYLHKFLNLIQCDLLVVKSNDPNVRDRLSCEEVDRKLSKMLRNCEDDADYAAKPAPWSRSPTERFQNSQKAVEADLTKPAVEALLRKDLRIYSGPTQKRLGPPSPTVPIDYRSTQLAQQCP